MGYAVCPKCGLDDQTCSVNQAINQSTSVSYISGTTIGWIDPDQVSSSWFTTTNVTALGESLSYPEKPFSFKWLGLCMILGLTLATVHTMGTTYGSMITDNNSLIGFFSAILFTFVLSLLVSGLPGFAYGILAYTVIAVLTIPSRILWKARVTGFLNAGYCYRDNLVFKGNLALPPHQYVSHVFGN